MDMAWYQGSEMPKEVIHLDMYLRSGTFEYPFLNNFVTFVCILLLKFSWSTLIALNDIFRKPNFQNLYLWRVYLWSLLGSENVVIGSHWILNKWAELPTSRKFKVSSETIFSVARLLRSQNLHLLTDLIIIHYWIMGIIL